MVSIGLLGMWIARFKKNRIYLLGLIPDVRRPHENAYQLARRPSLRQRLVLFKGLLEAQLLYRFNLPGAKHIFVKAMPCATI